MAIVGLQATPGQTAVLVVDPTEATSNDERGAAEAGRPFKTIAAAVDAAMPGDRVSIRSGVYRESIDLSLLARRMKALGADAPETILEARDATPPVIDAADVVTGWEAVGNGIYRKRPWTVNSQQVQVDGVQLQQIGGVIFGGIPGDPKHPLAKLHANQGGIWPGRKNGGLNDLVDNSFYYDADAQTLYVRTTGDLNARTVSVSTRTYSLRGQGLEHLTLRGLSFINGNTTGVVRHGIVTLSGRRLLLDTITIAQADGIGLLVEGFDSVIRKSSFTACGQLGMHVRGRGLKLIDNETSRNNTRGFNKWWEAGGLKAVGEGSLKDAEVAGHRAIANAGDGIWFDWGNDNVVVRNSVAAYNSGFGIQYEASTRGYILDNVAYGNGLRGIYVLESSNSVVAHNLVFANGMEGVVVIDEGRRDSSGRLDLTPRGNVVVGNIVGWNTRTGVILPGQRMDNASDENLYLGEAEPTWSLGWVSQGRAAPRGLAQWREASQQDRGSWYLRSAMPANASAALKAKQPLPSVRAFADLAKGYAVSPRPLPADVPASDLSIGGPPGPRSAR